MSRLDQRACRSSYRQYEATSNRVKSGPSRMETATTRGREMVVVWNREETDQGIPF